METFLPIREVVRITSLSKGQIYFLSARGQFPRQRKIYKRRVAWLHSEVLEWMKKCPAVQMTTTFDAEREVIANVQTTSFSVLPR